jgi:hypothetical protein
VTDDGRLRALVDQWRDEAEGLYEEAVYQEGAERSWSEGLAEAVTDCADELEAVLTAQTAAP